MCSIAQEVPDNRKSIFSKVIIMSESLHWGNIALEKVLYIVVLIPLWHPCTWKTLYGAVWKAPNNIAQNCSMLYYYSQDKINQIKTHGNLAQEAPGNIAYEKIPSNVVLIYSWNKIAQKILCNAIFDAPQTSTRK